MIYESKSPLDNTLILEDNSEYYFTVKPYELTNMLGNIIAILQEYNFTKKHDLTSPVYFKLYKTKEGNWYDFEDPKSAEEKGILRMLKSAIDSLADNFVYVENNAK